jgi:hypothetical protein
VVDQKSRQQYQAVNQFRSQKSQVNQHQHQVADQKSQVMYLEWKNQKVM